MSRTVPPARQLPVKPLLRVSLAVFFLTVSSFSASAQDRGAFFVGGLAETAFFSAESMSYGGGLILGSDGAAGLGLRALCFADSEGVLALEVCAFFRLYLPGLEEPRGLFLQINAGPSLYVIPGFSSRAGMFSVGIQAGWRFIFNKFYLEPAIRAGYPYLAGVGFSAGYLF
jgi:hypothetical protein